MENKILDPYCGISCAIVCFDVDRLEPLGELMIQHLIYVAERVCGAYIAGRIAAEL